ncbi:hypothetical protein NKH47_32125 [Mesorhizobium sp. M1060]|uniref:hypothetical protein n=1 Tax=unclassified Mesorhizobium TaxID=325217 RepID=UPI0003CE6EE6|nr:MULTISPECIES: hypothetical protein [unclassified Mesorhizobium]ESW84843.1 hypothetical protein X773_09120 [Mesorhizobium sp. LSJC285A00]ESX09126.1 hypothetical protein X768_19850 [Mesorhizobium sp. LSJC265A00]
MDTELLKLLPFVDNGKTIPGDMMLRLLNGVHDRADGEPRRLAANEILSGAGDYLPRRGYLSDFISGKLPQTEAVAIISSRKKYLERMRYLLPSILKILGVREGRNLNSIMLRIDDCCHDFPIVAKSAHEKKVRKAIRTDIAQIRNLAQELRATLEKAETHINHELEQHVAILRDEQQGVPSSGVEVLNQQLDWLRVAADIALYRDDVGENGFYVGDNKAKTHVVECAYDMAIWYGRPAFVTTPGSDFSFLCALLFELAGGGQDASLAGAISKFARSALRKKLDSDAEESRQENSDDYLKPHVEDNFLHVTRRIEELTGEARFWKAMMESRAWDDAAKYHLSRRLLAVLEDIQDANQRHGPHRVWSDPIDEVELARFVLQEREREAALLQLEIETGRKQRSVDLILAKGQKRDQHGGGKPR